MRHTLAVLALASLAAATNAAEPPELLKPMAFLAGHCWKGNLADGKTDEHCFAWMLGGHALRDTHTVRTAGQPDFTGETIYDVDSAARRVEFLYVESTGGISHGRVESSPEALLFVDARYVSDGETMTYRARWTREGDTAYEAWSEAQTPKGWVTMFRGVLRRMD